MLDLSDAVLDNEESLYPESASLESIASTGGGSSTPLGLADWGAGADVPDVSVVAVISVEVFCACPSDAMMISSPCEIRLWKKRLNVVLFVVQIMIYSLQTWPVTRYL